MPTLYGYYRSSASYRVRIALNLKKVTYQHMGIHLLRDGGEQHQHTYKTLNPQGLVPSLVTEGQTFTQSLAIIEYLNERFPEPPLLPATPEDRAHIRAFAEVITSDIHPLNNLRVLQYLKHKLHVDDHQKEQWIHQWIGEGFTALDRMLAHYKHVGEFCFGNQVTIADICLIPQVYNAERYGFSMSDFPTLSRINERCLKIPAFQAAHPDKQPDAPE